MNSNYSTKEMEEMAKLMHSPLYFAKKFLKLTPQPIKPEYEELKDSSHPSEWKAEWWGDWDDDREKWIWHRWQKGKYLTWQQTAFLKCVELAVQKKEKPRISIRSGHGIGKTAALSILLLWGLLTHKDSQIPCTAPTADQIFDVLWKEVAVWHRKLPDGIKEYYEIKQAKVEMTANPKAWFARARTARKENPEALAGVHADFVMALVDEASGVPNEIYTTAEGALTGKEYLMILISNATRLQGYFFETHHGDKKQWQTLHFSSDESPVVDKKYRKRIVEKYGEDSDEYRVRVQGKFPAAEGMDDKGYIPVFNKNNVTFSTVHDFKGTVRMGIDPSGEGKDTTSWVVRDNLQAKVVAEEKISNPKSIAMKTLTLIEEYDVSGENIWIDNFGEGANVAQELALSHMQIRVNAVNVGMKASDSNRYLNKRAEVFFRIKEWLRQGGKIPNDKRWEELFGIKYKQNLSGKIQIMSKQDMAKEGLRSPNNADALALTFFEEWHEEYDETQMLRENILLRDSIKSENVLGSY